MANKVKIAVVIIISVIAGYILYSVSAYNIKQKENAVAVAECLTQEELYDSTYKNSELSDGKYTTFLGAMSNPDSCFCKMYELFLPRLAVYKIKDKDVQFLRLSHTFVIIPSVALENADEIILTNNKDKLFEKNIKELFQKNILGYTVNKQNDTDIIKNKLQQMRSENKKVYIKIDETSTKTFVIPEILNYSDNLTGISITIQTENTEKLIKYNEILKSLEKDFVLISRNPDRMHYYDNCKCRYAYGKYPVILELSYINKNLTKSVYLPFEQDFHDEKNHIDINGIYQSIPEYDIKKEIILSKKINLDR